MPITQNAALFAVIGTNFGGNGTTIFALPDLEGNVPVGTGTGPGLSPYVIGEFGGSQSVTLQHDDNPNHSHALQASGINATDVNPAGKIYAKGRYTNSDGNSGPVQLYGTAAPAVQQVVSAIGYTGGGQPHNNMMPTLAINFCICLDGIFPSRT
jgi:microcystin-dependent protein